MIGYLYLILAILGASVGQLLLKQYNMQNTRFTFSLLIALVLLVSVPLFIYMSLKYLSFSIVFLSDAISIAMIVVLSYLFLNEVINLKKIVGIICIIFGIILLKGKVL